MRRPASKIVSGHKLAVDFKCQLMTADDDQDSFIDRIALTHVREFGRPWTKIQPRIVYEIDVDDSPFNETERAWAERYQED
jgi:hypothetical protein